MGISESPELVDFDASGALEAGQATAGAEFLACVEYTRQDFNPLYVATRFLDRYSGREELHAHLEEILSYCYIDFSERQLFETKLQAAGTVQYFLTRMEHVFLVRMFTRSQGLLLFLTPDAPITETIDSMRTVMLDTDTVEESPYHT